MQNIVKGYAIMLVVVFVIGFDAVTVKLTGLSGLDVAFWRNGGISLCMFMGACIVYRKNIFRYLSVMTTKQWLASLLFGASGTFFSIAVEMTSAVNVLLMYVLSPLIAVGLTTIFLGERINNVVKVCSVFVVGGTFFAYKDSFDSGLDLGIVMAFIFVLCNSGMSVVGRAVKNIPSPIIIGIGCAFWSLLMLLFTNPVLPASPLGMWNLVANILVVAITYVGLVQGARYITAPEVNLMLIMETLFGTLMAYLILKEVPTYANLIGGGVAFIAVAVNMAYVVYISKKKHKSSV